MPLLTPGLKRSLKVRQEVRQCLVLQRPARQKLLIKNRATCGVAKRLFKNKMVGIGNLIILLLLDFYGNLLRRG